MRVHAIALDPGNAVAAFRRAFATAPNRMRGHTANQGGRAGRLTARAPVRAALNLKRKANCRVKTLSAGVRTLVTSRREPTAAQVQLQPF